LNPGPSVLDARPDLIHLCQSHYAHDFLTRLHVRPLLMLTDFLTDDAFTPGPPSGRLPMVAYNPKRVSDAMRRLMKQAGQHIWLPLENMDKTALAEVLREVRVYVDIGHHPGRDRIPREAASCGAVVITGRQGAAGFAGDMPLPGRFRLNDHAMDTDPRGLALIEQLLTSETAFMDAWSEQAPYRDWIRHNKDAFLAEVETFIASMHLRGSGDGVPTPSPAASAGGRGCTG
jgi:hypothetical protein